MRAMNSRTPRTILTTQSGELYSFMHGGSMYAKKIPGGSLNTDKMVLHVLDVIKSVKPLAKEAA